MPYWVRSALPLATEGTQECIWNLSYNDRRMAIELELAKSLEEEVKYAEIPNYCDVKCLAATGTKAERSAQLLGGEFLDEPSGKAERWYE